MTGADNNEKGLFSRLQTEVDSLQNSIISATDLAEEIHPGAFTWFDTYTKRLRAVRDVINEILEEIET